tara:strand:- start:982 stop:1833 length:852 start_codon:yes stop_codon:yes gene_type:complete
MDKNNNHVFLIAEIGINHNGDLDIVKKLISEAAEAGFDAVKFQKRTVEKVYTKEYLDNFRESPWGKTQREQKNGLEFNIDQYKLIEKFCKEKKIKWSASAWDEDAQKFLSKFDIEFNKIASPMLGHMPLLKLVASEKKKTFISTGMSTLDELDKVVEIFEKEKCPFELMHCNSTYPMPDEMANLKCIETLRKRYNCNVGYSGHESRLILISVAAVMLGATSIERHVTLDRTMYGSDQAASIETKALKQFVNDIRAIPIIKGNGIKELSPSEEATRKKLRVDVN